MALASWLASSAPDTAIEIAPEAVSVAVLASRGGETVIQAYAAAPVPSGAIVAGLGGRNVIDRPAVVAALQAACERAGHRPRRAALAIPDLAARVTLVRFEQLPGRSEDLDQLIRWQVRKSLPFAIEDACVTHSPGARSGTGGEFITVAARRETVREYEGVCDDAGIHAGIVDLSTLCVVNLYQAVAAQGSGDTLVVHVRPEYTSIAILRRGDLIFFRTRPEGEEESLSDVVHQTAMYYQDRLAGEGFARVFAGGTTRPPGGVELARRDLQARLDHAVDPLDPALGATLGERVTVSGDDRAALAPLVGLLLRARKGAVAA
jgi:type IV pilus assembly protein PilM